MKHNNSSYWLGEDFYNDDIDILTGELPTKPKGKDPMKLAGYRRAIGNFVRIVTGKGFHSTPNPVIVIQMVT